MRRKHLLILVVALATTLSLAFMIPVAADNGRDPGATPGAPIGEAGATPGDTGSDQDVPGAVTNTLRHTGNSEIDGSLGIGFDTVANQNYGFDTLRLSENNLRIKFNDTSTSASFPRNDWEITVNDSANGGASYYAITDHTNGFQAFRIEANSLANALTVDAQGDIGIGTRPAALDLQITRGDTPSIRLEQNGSSGFTPQTFDLASNEAGFFVRDATSGSTLPLRIRPGAPSSAVDIAASGDVGLGVGGSNVDRPLHIRRSGATDPEIRLENVDDSNGYFEMRVNDSGALIFRPDEANINMVFFDQTAVGNQKLYTIDNGAGTEVLSLQTDGDLVITGMLTSSDRSLKTKIRAVEAHSILDKVNQLDISTWAYKANVYDRHIGPMAQDWYSIIGLGSTPTHISQTDVNGVLLSSIEALSAQNDLLAAQNDLLATQNTDLESRLSQLEKQLAALMAALTG